jgi:hypothetical protein
MRAACAALAVSAVACGGGGHAAAPTGPTGPTGATGPQPQKIVDAWPVANVTYGPADGILEGPVVSMSMDEGQNRWVATTRALYLLRPGDKKFTRFDETNGLHLGMMTGQPPGPVGWAKYCDMAPVANDAPCGGTVTWGGAALNGILSLAGGEANEVFVGYGGTHTVPDVVCPDDTKLIGYDWCDPYAHTGKIDWVRLQPDGTLKVVRFDLVSNQMGAKFWHDRSMYRLVYDHSDTPHGRTLYSGTEHGVTIFFPDKYRAPKPGEWFDSAYSEYMGDHLHARVCRFDPPEPCRPPPHDEDGQRMGDWRGLAVDANGSLWHAGKWTAGRITWVPDPHQWVFRNGAAFDVAFGDPYGGPGNGNAPVFEVAAEGHEPRMTGVAVCPDGRVWYTSRGAEDGPAAARGDVLAAFDGHAFRYYTGADIGLGENRAVDVACLPDGHVVVAGYTTGLVVLDPAKGTSSSLRASSGLLPSDRIRMIEVNPLTSPATLEVATDGGAAAIRVYP